VDYTSLRLPILESRLDWITATAPHDDTGLQLFWFATERTMQQKSNGGHLEKWRMQGYEGWQSGNWACGYGRQGGLLRVTGEEAQRWAPKVAELAKHWSRVDYCVTVQDPGGQIDPSHDYWHEWPWRENPLRAPVQLERRQTFNGGSTTTIGQRSAAYYARVYDKSAESPGEYPIGCWRWEIELKRHVSEAHQRRWLQGDLGESFARDLIATEFKRHHLTVPWDSTTLIERTPQIKPKRDVDRTLTWLRRQVRHSVDFAVESAGVDAVLEALNLPRVTYEWR